MPLLPYIELHMCISGAKGPSLLGSLAMHLQLKLVVSQAGVLGMKSTCYSGGKEMQGHSSLLTAASPSIGVVESVGKHSRRRGA